MNRKKNKNKAKRRNKGGGPNGSFRGVILLRSGPMAWRRQGRIKSRDGAEMTTRQALWGGSMQSHTGMTGGSNTIYYVNSGGFAASFAFSLSDLPQASSWTAVFDQYRFEEVEIHLYPINNCQISTTTSTNVAACSQMVLDFDDSNALGSENAALEYDTVQTFMPYDHIVVRMKPAVSPAYYSSGAFTGYGVAPSDKEWIDAASPAVVHYGVKMWVGSLIPTSTMVSGWQVYAQYTVSFRNTR